MEKVLSEIQSAETGSLRTKDRTSPSSSLSGENSCVVLSSKLLVHSVEETDLAAAYSYVTCRNILIRTDALPKLSHKCLAETHDFVV